MKTNDCAVELASWRQVITIMIVTAVEYCVAVSSCTKPGFDQDDIRARDEVYSLGMECQLKMKELEERCQDGVTSVVDSLTEKHKQEVRFF